MRAPYWIIKKMTLAELKEWIKCEIKENEQLFGLGEDWERGENHAYQKVLAMMEQVR